jgi:hypothetical protein
MTNRVRPWVFGAALFVCAAALVAFASLPTGAATPEGVVPGGARVVTTKPVGEARALLASESGELRLHVAYKGPKRWLGVRLKPAPPGAAAVWAGTTGEGGVPALSAVYGRVGGAAVRVEWADGRVSTELAASDGMYLAVRPGRVAAARVVVLDDSGIVVTEVAGL